MQRMYANDPQRALIARSFRRHFERVLYAVQSTATASTSALAAFASALALTCTERKPPPAPL
jgi:hypothetical protein